MTLSLENLHSTANKKHGTQTVLTYAQSFASSMKESAKQNSLKISFLSQNYFIK